MEHNARAADAMRAATWTSVEAMGIPPSPVRKVVFDLADIMDNHPSADLLALASGAMRGVMDALTEHYKPQTALELQLETIRVQRELAEMTGVETPAVVFTESDFDLPPASPAELAKQLGYEDGGRAVRRLLRIKFADRPSSGRWEPLTTEQINYARAHLSSKR